MDISPVCSPYQGANFKKDKQDSVGYITALKIGSKTFTADLSCADPTDTSKSVKAVMVLSKAKWSTGKSDAIYFNGEVSATTQSAMYSLGLNDMTDVTVEFQFTVYKFDAVKTPYAYYKHFHSNDTTMKGMLEKDGSDYTFEIGDSKLDTFKDAPQVFPCYLGIKPQNTEQDIQIATSQTDKSTKKWGVTVG